MPNQRARHKLYIGGFVDKKLHARILLHARRAGMQDNKFGFVAGLLQEGIKRRATRPNGKALRAKR